MAVEAPRQVVAGAGALPGRGLCRAVVAGVVAGRADQVVEEGACLDHRGPHVLGAGRVPAGRPRDVGRVRVTRAVDGRCVRGDLTAKVDGKQWFRVSGLGNCDAPSTPTRTPPATWQPPDDGRPAPTVTVTVTRTIWCQKDPNCLPVEGK